MHLLLRAIGVTCLVVVLGRHIDLHIWQGCALSFGSMLVLGSFD